MATKAAIGRTATQPARAHRRSSMLQRGLLYALVPSVWFTASRNKISSSAGSVGLVT